MASQGAWPGLRIVAISKIIRALSHSGANMAINVVHGFWSDFLIAFFAIVGP